MTTSRKLAVDLRKEPRGEALSSTDLRALPDGKISVFQGLNKSKILSEMYSNLGKKTYREYAC